MDGKNSSKKSENLPPAEALEGPGASDAGDNSKPIIAPSTPKGPKPDALARISGDKRVYLWGFVLVVILAGAVIYFTQKWSQRGTPKTSQSSLSSDQLSALAANSTSVGNSSQTLDVQSNAIFENQILAKNDLTVAGSLKLGGSLSLASINVSGAGSVDQLQVNRTLSVAGDATVQGQLSVQKSLAVSGNANFGSLSAGQITATSLQFTGNLTLSSHFVTAGTGPGKSNGSALGSGGTASVNGSDTAGTVDINTGSSPPSGCFVTINFAQKFSTIPHVIISPSNSAASGLNYYANRTATNFSICSSSSPAASTTYLFDYVVID